MSLVGRKKKVQFAMAGQHETTEQFINWASCILQLLLVAQHSALCILHWYKSLISFLFAAKFSKFFFLFVCTESTEKVRAKHFRYGEYFLVFFTQQQCALSFGQWQHTMLHAVALVAYYFAVIKFTLIIHKTRRLWSLTFVVLDKQI